MSEFNPIENCFNCANKENVVELLEAERAKVAKLEAQNNRLIAAINYMLDTLDVIQFRDAANMRLHTQHPAYEKLQQAISEES